MRVDTVSMRASTETISRAPPTERLSDSYARWRSSRLGQITDVLERQLLFDIIGPIAEKTLLDVGCGDGSLASELARRGATVTGLDADPAMLDAARRRTRTEATHVQFVEGEAEHLPFDDSTFDCVAAVAMLCFVQDAGCVVAEMARVLKPGGRLVIGELGYWSLWAVHRRIRGWLGNLTWRAAVFRTAKELRGLAQGAGLGGIKIRGAVHYPPCGFAAKLFAPVDRWIGRQTSIGAAFLAVSAVKPRNAAV